jgi:ABC-type phosphate transport system substrate-binding protein
MGPVHQALLTFLLIASVAEAALVSQQAAAPPALAIIVHHSNPVEGLTFGELRHIFLLDTQNWPNGRKITVVLRQKGQQERDEALRIVCGLSEREYDRHILLRIFQGSVTIGPREIQSAPGMLRFVYNAPGAIGYVRADEVDASVKVVRVDGMLPDDPKYPVRRRASGRPDMDW